MAKTKSVEENFEQLEEIIKQLEDNELPLDEAFKSYESGVKLVSELNKQLDKVEKQIIILQEKSEDNE